MSRAGAAAPIPPLAPFDATEFWNLAKKSKGRPGSLYQRDRTRMKNIVGKAIRG